MTYTPENTGCWQQVSGCIDGFSLAFWIKVISGPGINRNAEGVISAMRSKNKEGWGIIVLKWDEHFYLKMEVQDYRITGAMSSKEIDTVSFGEWVHYVVTYKYRDPGNVNAQFRVFKNGESHDLMSSYLHGDFTSDEVDKITFGRWFHEDSSYPLGDALLDELIIFDGNLDDNLAQQLYRNYTH